MRSRVALVAKRELVENVRTKTFWLGIMMFPFLLTAAILIPALLDKRKAVRHYAVIDGSGWLLDEVDRRADVPDFEKVFAVALERLREQAPSFDELPASVREPVRALGDNLDEIRAQPTLPKEFRQLDDEALEEKLIGMFTQGLSQLDRPEFQQVRAFAPEAFDALTRQRETIRDWWQALPPDEAKQFGSAISKSRYRRIDLASVGLEGQALRDELNRRIAEKELFAYFVIDDDPVAGDEPSQYVSANLTDTDLREWFGDLASAAVRERRLAAEDIPADIARWVQEPIELSSKKIGAGGAEEDVAIEDQVRQWAPVAFVYLLWFSVFMVAQMLLTNTVEEKSNRIMEVLLSSISPIQLMAGKILGIAATGLTMIGAWGVFFYLIVTFLPPLIGLDMEIDLLAIASDPIYLISFLVYFLLGYLLYAAILVGLGAVCSSLKEAQNLMGPLTLVMVIPVMLMTLIAKDPNSTLAKILSYFPPYTPFVMMNRAAGPPTTMEYVLTTILLLVAVAVAMWAAAKIFRIGILMTGKTPNPREIWRWLRAPVGQVPVRKP